MSNKEARSRNEVNQDLPYIERYRLLQTNISPRLTTPPFRAFIKERLPFQLKSGQKEVVFAHALALKREWSQQFWKEKTDQLRLTERERKDVQIVVIPPSRQKNGDGDFSKKFYADLKRKPLGKYPVAKFIRGQKYGNEPYESEYLIENFKKAKSIYIIASPLSKSDFADINFVAGQYLMNGAKEIILVAPFMADQREDKNVKKTKPGEQFVYNGRIIKIMHWMKSLSPSISKIITFETHSSATQAFAALAGIPLVPISYEEELIGEISPLLRKKDFNPNKWKVVRPDVGRNLVATRIEDHFKIEGIHMSQVRNSDTLEKKAIDLSEELKLKLKGTNVILYDDEAGTFKTMKNVVHQLIRAEVRNINIFLGHARLQQRWTQNLKWIIEKCRKKNISFKVYVTDSRVPIGGLKDFMEQYPEVIKRVSVAKKTRNVIEANIENIDFWAGKFNGVDYEREILQYTESELSNVSEEK